MSLFGCYNEGMVKIISDYGFCFGVQSAIDHLCSIKKNKGNIYLTHPLLHNKMENEDIMKKVGAKLLSDEVKVDKDDILVLSAHGHALEEEKNEAGSEILDCTCPLIIRRYERILPYQEDVSYLYLGKKNHQETIGFLSHFPYFQLIESTKDVLSELKSLSLKEKVVFIPQTTVSKTSWLEVENFLKENKKEILQALPICPLYEKRSMQAIECLKDVDPTRSLFLVCGDQSSSNAKEIFSSIQNAYPGMKGYIVLKKEDFPSEKYKGFDFYLASATSVSKKSVLDLKKELELL